MMMKREESRLEERGRRDGSKMLGLVGFFDGSGLVQLVVMNACARIHPPETVLSVLVGSSAYVHLHTLLYALLTFAFSRFVTLRCKYE